MQDKEKAKSFTGKEKEKASYYLNARESLFSLFYIQRSTSEQTVSNFFVT